MHNEPESESNQRNLAQPDLGVHANVNVCIEDPVTSPSSQGKKQFN